MKNEEYLRTVRRPYPPLWASLICRGIAREDCYEPFVAERFAMRNMIKWQEVWYYGRQELADAGRVALGAWQRPGVLAQVERLFDEQGEALLAAAQAGAELPVLAQAYERYMPALILVFGADGPVARAIEAALARSLPAHEVRSFLDQLNVPLKDNYYKVEELELAAAADVRQHAEKWEWLYSRYGAETPYTFEEALARKREIDAGRLRAERERVRLETAQAIARAKAVLGSQDILVDLMQFVVYYRTQRTDVINRAAYHYIPKLKEVAANKGISYQQLLHATYDELTGDLPPRDILDQRIHEHVVILEDGASIRCLSGRDIQPIAELLHEEVAEVTRFNGTVACRGKASGAVRLIFHSSDLDTVGEGDILVTSMTTPDMVPAMRRAGAIVTDEGGITCHAAITSRELGKPCVIGTKVATRVLKDGDVVEVDAERGIVKVIKRAGA